MFRPPPPLLRGYRRLLFVGAHAEAVDFLFGEVTPVTPAQVLLGESGKLDAVELDNLVAQGLKDASHNTVLARMNLDAHLLLVNGIGILHVVGLYFTILEHDALRNLLQVMSRHVLIKIYMIDLLLQIFRMCQL